MSGSKARGTERLTVFLLTRSLEIGGAQRQLVILARGLKECGHEVTVGVFYGGGSLATELHDDGIKLIELCKKGRWDLIPFLRRLLRELRILEPDVIYSFLGSANVLASVIHPFIRRSRLVWSVRASNVALGNYDWLHRIAYKLECSLSGSPDLIIANSEAGAAFSVRNGFPEDKLVVIPNGVDISMFRPDPGVRAVQRRAFGLRDGEIAVGVLARLDPMKGHRVLLQAARIVRDRGSNHRFFCIGNGPLLSALEQTAKQLRLGDAIVFTGEREPVAALNALDIYCSCSVWGEGHSNSVAEAMACGLPCVVTDVGDSARLVGSTGLVVPPGSPEALADALMAQAASLANYDNSRPIERIREHFSAAVMTAKTLETFRKIEEGRSAEA